MKPYPYQEIGRDFLASRKRALLADRMGLGKTVQAILAAKKIGALNTLVVAPASTIPNWEAEWDAWEGPGHVRFVSYSKLIYEQTHGYAPDLIIMDESHYCKNPLAKRTRTTLGIASRATYAWALTGTPMPNDPTELYPAFKYLWPEKLDELGIKTPDAWMRRFCLTRYTEYGEKPYAVKNGALLRTMLEDVMLRRGLGDVGFDLPPLRVDLHRFPKTEVDLSEYADYDGQGEEAYNATLRRLLGLAKAGPVASQIVGELDEGQYNQIVVLYYHNDTRDVLRDAFDKGGVSVVGFGGSANATQRADAIATFQAGGAQVFLAQQTAAGTGLNLQSAHEIVLVEPAWSPVPNQQAITRIHRIGQDSPCRARIFTVAGTIDESIIGAIKTKLQMQTTIGL